MKTKTNEFIERARFYASLGATPGVEKYINKALEQAPKDGQKILDGTFFSSGSLRSFFQPETTSQPASSFSINAGIFSGSS